MHAKFAAVPKACARISKTYKGKKLGANSFKGFVSLKIFQTNHVTKKINWGLNLKPYGCW